MKQTLISQQFAQIRKAVRQTLLYIEKEIV